MFERIKKKIATPTKAELWQTILEMRKDSEKNAYLAGWGAGYQRAIEEYIAPCDIEEIDLADLEV